MYDADTFVTFNLVDSCYDLNNAKNKIKLEKFQKKYDYFNTETTRQQKYINTVINDNKQVSLDLLKIKCTNFDLHNFIARTNNYILNKFLKKPTVQALDGSSDTSEVFADIKYELKKSGKPIPINDVWIASHAVETGSILITYDEHFKTIPGIRLWDKIKFKISE